MKKFILTALAMVAIASVPVIAEEVIIYESFSGTGDLNATVPDVGSGTWSASVEVNKDGTFDSGTGTGDSYNDDNAFFAFTPEAGNVYTLSATIDPTTGTSWIALGFTGLAVVTDDFWDNSVSTIAPWLMFTSGGAVNTYLGSATNTADKVTIGTSFSGALDFSIVLDTTDTVWTAEWFINGISVRAATPLASQTAGISYVGFGRDKGQLGIVDDFKLTVTDTGAASNPTPANGAIDVPTSTATLSWDKGTAENITAHYLYMVEGEPNFVGVLPVTVTALTNPIVASMPITLQTDTRYYWYVDESINSSLPSDSNTLSGPLWSFDTVNTVPEIIDNPTDTAVFPGQTASFSASLSSLTAPTVTWYRVGDPDVEVVQGGDYTIAVTDLGSGNYTAVLDIANVEIADEGSYYVSVTNSSPTVVDSDSAGLTVKRLLSRYPFDSSLEDAVGSYDGTPFEVVDGNSVSMTPAYPGGIIGTGALELNGSQYIELPTDAYPKAGIGSGLLAGSFACWVKAGQIPAGQTNSVLFGVVNQGDDTACQSWFTADTVNFRIRNASNGSIPFVTGSAAILDGQWHLVAATYNGSVGQLYVDGVKAGSPVNYQVNIEPTDWDAPMYIGANNDSGVSGFLNGALDELQFYNYELTPFDIADIYLQGYPDTHLCILDYASEFDIAGPLGDTPDCIVNLYDVAKFASNWLSCGSYPDCQ